MLLRYGHTDLADIKIWHKKFAGKEMAMHKYFMDSQELNKIIMKVSTAKTC
jgi:hypothetical protein